MKKILIINANYYNEITSKLVEASISTLKKKKIKISIITVPGVFEIPIAIRKNIKRFDGFVAIGCVIKGRTPHFDLITKSTFDAILNLSILFNKPIKIFSQILRKYTRFSTSTPNVTKEPVTVLNSQDSQRI